MVYLHGSDERQQAIADELSKQAAEQLGRVEGEAIGHATGTAAPAGIMTGVPGLGRCCLTWDSRCAPRPRLERGTYCLGGSRSIR